MRVLAKTLLERIHAREARVGVVGLGYVGLPLGMAFAEAGFPVTGLDVDTSKLEKIARGESYIRHIPSEPLKKLSEQKRLTATSDFSKARDLDCVVVCVPTPLTRQHEPDMSYIINTAEALAPYVRREQLFVLESTTYPGTTEEVFRPILERTSGLKAGVDFHLCFSPEREDPGNAHFNTRTIPKVVGGLTPQCGQIASALYGSALKQVVTVSSCRVAEMTKLLENIFRCVNIAMVNELKMLCDAMGMDIWEVIAAASTKPFGFMPFHPGPGLGGHCIPIDPYYLTWKAREFEFQTKFIELAGDINIHMPHYVVERTMKALNQRGKPLHGANLLVLGVAYKKDIDDLRESPSLRVIELLQKEGAVVAYHDPFIPSVVPDHGHSVNLKSTPLSSQELARHDAVLVLTDHSCIDYGQVVQHAKLVVDTRNATRVATSGREKIVKA
jgi:UDP-N-acetyl-D-glucosamine dehydrogenase